MIQGVYYYFYQIFRSRAEAAALAQKKLGIGDGSVGMFSSLVVAALAGYFAVKFLWISFVNTCLKIVDCLQSWLTIKVCFVPWLCRCVNVLLTNPIWVVVTRMQVINLLTY